MLIAVIFSFLLEHNQQIIYFCSFITKPLLTDFFTLQRSKVWRLFCRVGFVYSGDTLPVIRSLWTDGRMLVEFDFPQKHLECCVSETRVAALTCLMSLNSGLTLNSSSTLSVYIKLESPFVKMDKNMKIHASTPSLQQWRMHGPDSHREPLK